MRRANHFYKKDMEEVNFFHSNEIIIKATIRGEEVSFLLVDNGNSCDILYLDTFMKIGIKPISLKPCTRDLVGFIGHEAQP